MTSDMIPCELSEYELRRNERILENERFLKSLGISDIVNEIKTSTTAAATKKNNKRKKQLPSIRKSCRIDKVKLTADSSSSTTNNSSSDSNNNNSNAYCRFKISLLDFKRYINANYLDQRISHRVSTYNFN
jgi:hypothetical protein